MTKSSEEKLMFIITVLFGVSMLIWETFLGFLFGSVMLFLYWVSHDFGGAIPKPGESND